MKQIEEVVAHQRAFFLNGNTLDYDVRKEQLQNLKQMLKDNERVIYHALKKI
nr:hypothetical protein [Virgibacillus sp. NKC19-3]